ncbi:UDP-4-amino-4-deoxy-L-arabinose--oxoglutarate aminotransferase [Planctomycetes bacterium MalM25]|nr:UDP-4-amino-4-deoxy-L-arabinose--oxoglutarate aminotransferase [Planctomycetes bacterium MalM25]
MIPRTRFDIGWKDLGYGFRQIAWAGDRLSTQRELESQWVPDGETLACLSLRSGFDVALEAYAFPPGSEVLMSCMNIGPMAEIASDRGLTPISIDLNMDTLQMRPELLEKAVNSKTRAIVHAHVLGSRQPLDELRRFADRHGLVLFEDCAQAYRGDAWRGDPRSDVTLFSFGPLKTCSATMGGFVSFRDPARLAKARRLQSQRPVQGRYQFFDRLMLFSELLFFTQELPYSLVMGIARRLGLSELMNTPVRNFRGRNQLKKLRKQPGYPLLALLLHRLKTFDPDLVRRRMSAAETVLRRIPEVPRPGRQADDHGYWLFPVNSDDPVGLRRRLHQEGFDSTLGHKAFVVLDSPPDRPEVQPVEAPERMSKSLYLPIHFRMKKRDLVRLANVIDDFEPSSPPGDGGPPAQEEVEIEAEAIAAG